MSKIRKARQFIQENQLNLFRPKDIAFFTGKALMKLGERSQKEIADKENLPSEEKTESKSWEYDYLIQQTKLTKAQEDKMWEASQSMLNKTQFSVLLIIENPCKLYKAFRRIKHQAYEYFEIIVIGSDEVQEQISDSDFYQKCEFYSSFDEAVSFAQGDYLLILLEEDIIYPNTLFEFALKIGAYENKPEIVFSDYDFYDDRKRKDPCYLVGTGIALMQNGNTVLRAAAVSKTAFSSINIDADFSTIEARIHDKYLKIAEKFDCSHIDGILFSFNRQLSEYTEHDKIITKTVQRNNFGNNGKMIYPIHHKNIKASIIVPVIDFDTDIVIREIRDNTQNKNYEIIFVGNVSSHLADCSSIPADVSLGINKMINQALEYVNTDIIVIFNPHCRICQDNWLDLFIAELADGKTSAVVPLSLNKQDIVRESGAFLTASYDGYIPYFLDVKRSDEHFCNLINQRRDVIAPLGPCVALKKESIHDIGGFDSDLSYRTGLISIGIRLNQSGQKSIYNPAVEMIFDSLMEDTVQDKKKLAECFKDYYIFGDPYFNKYLSDEYSNLVLNMRPVLPFFTGTPSLSKRNIEKILLIKPDHIGDAVLSIPAVRMVREKYPSAHITMLCGPWTKSLFDMQPEINKVKTFAFFREQSQHGSRNLEKQELDELIHDLREECYDLTINLRRHEEAKYVASQSSDICLSYSSTAEQDRFSHPVPAFKDLHHVDVKWSMADELKMLVNAADLDTRFDLPLTVDSQSMISARKKMEEISFFQQDLPLVGIHLGAGHETRQWGYHHFAELADLIIQYTDANVMFLGGKDDEQYNEKVISLMKQNSRTISVAGYFNLKEFIYIQGQLDYFIGNNSGPMHVAGIMGTPTLGVFADTFSDQGWGPLGKKSITVKMITDCAICDMGRRNQCPHEMMCLEKLYPKDAFLAFLRLMQVYPMKRGV